MSLCDNVGTKFRMFTARIYYITLLSLQRQNKR